jgi:hypothetical protein
MPRPISVATTPTTSATRPAPAKRLRSQAWRKVEADGAAFETYTWFRPGSDVPVEKLSYARLFAQPQGANRRA